MIMSGFWLRGVHVSGLSMFDRESDTDSDTLETRLKGVVNAITVISYRWYGRLRRGRAARPLMHLTRTGKCWKDLIR